MTRLLPLALVLALSPAVATAQSADKGFDIYINEVDSDQTGVDSGEFVEIACTAGLNFTTNQFSLVFFRAAGTRYRAVDLTGACPADGFYVYGDPGVANVDESAGFSAASSQILNSASAVALYNRPASDFPTNAPATLTGLEDVMIMGVDDSRLAQTSGLMTAFVTRTQVQNEEDYNDNAETESLQRLNNRQSKLFYAVTPTPGVTNIATITRDLTADIIGSIEQGGDDTIDEAAGYRQMSLPLVQPGVATDPFDVDDLAALNLVQAVPGGTNPAQYPTYPGPAGAGNGDILFTNYDGNDPGTFGRYVEAPSTDHNIRPGEGLFWYWYDADKTPDPSSFGTGTSVGYDLANPAFGISLTGRPARNSTTGNIQVTRTSDDGFYLVGNPYPFNFFLGGIQVSSGTLSTTFRVWLFTDQSQTTTGSFQTLIADTGNPFNGDVLPIWNGVFAEATGGAVAKTFIFPSDFADPTNNTPFIGKSQVQNDARLTLAMRGVTESGHRTMDIAPMIRFVDEATTDWDRHDASKLVGPAYPRAILSPVGTRDGESIHQDVLSLPFATTEVVEIPLDFAVTDAGQYQITGDLSTLPDGWSAIIVDTETGDEVDLSVGAVEFSSDATDGWASRYVLKVTPSGVVSTETGAEGDVFLGSAFPNPSSDRTALSLRLAESENVRAAAYDALGREVAVLHDGAVAAGVAETLTLDTAELAAGVYVIRVEGESFVDSRRVTVVR